MWLKVALSAHPGLFLEDGKAAGKLSAAHYVGIGTLNAILILAAISGKWPVWSLSRGGTPFQYVW